MSLESPRVSMYKCTNSQSHEANTNFRGETKTALLLSVTIKGVLRYGECQTRLAVIK